MTAFSLFDSPDYGAHNPDVASHDGQLGDGFDDRGEPERPLVSLRSPVQPFALPAQPTPLIGRDELVTRLTEFLDAPERRLLTLVGPGGVGKTRLACELARQRERKHEIVRFIDLAQLNTSASVAPLVQQALGPTRLVSASFMEQNLIMLGNQRTLLILDNFEHVIDAAPVVAEMLADAPWLQIIVTSRTALRLRWEHVCAVPPLESPPAGELPCLDDLAAVPSVALFTTFVRRLQPDFALTAENARTVAEICRRMDGLPLALELAAADLRVMPLERLLERVYRPLATLVRGPRDLPERQQTMRATIEWSYALLSPEEQRVVRHLAIFAGGGTISAVAEIVQLPAGIAYDVMANLAEQHLFEIVEKDHAEPRFRMQHMVREYLTERLALDNEHTMLRERFIAYHSRLAVETTAQLAGSTADTALRVLQAEIDNLRSILDLSIEPRYLEHGLRLAIILTPFWAYPGQLSEGRHWLERLGTLAPDDVHELRIEARVAATRLAVMAGDLITAHLLLADARLDSDPLDKTAARATLTAWSCYVLLLRGYVDGAALMLETAPELCGEDRTSFGAPADISPAFLRALIAVERGDDAAGDLLAEALAALDRAANHPYTIEIVCTQAELALNVGDVGEAARLFANALVRAQVAGSPRARIQALIGLGDIAAGQLTTDEALRHYRTAFEIARDYHDERAILRILERTAILGISSRIVPSLLRMIGLADAMRVRLDAGRSRLDERRVVPRLHHARQMLGDDEFNRIRAEGETMSLAQVGTELAAGASTQHVVTPVAARGERPPATIEQLTRREREVVQQISKGHTNRQIAANLGMAERTVDSHIGNIRQKLQLSSRAQIAVWAVANGLSSPE